MKKIVPGFLLLLAGFVLAGCSGSGGDTPTVIGSKKAITSFSFESISTQGLINEADHSIAVTVPSGTIITSLSPTISHNGKSLSPGSGVTQNFSSPVNYTVSAADGSVQTYRVTVNIASSTDKFITSFRFESVNAAGVINETNRTITVTVPYGTDLTALVPTIIHSGNSINPGSGISRNFSSQVSYTVTAGDGSMRIYTVTVNVAPRSDKAITAFNFTSISTTSTINEANHTIQITVPYNTNKASLTPSIVHNGARITPASGVACNFTDPVAYTVTAADGSAQIYTVTVLVSAKNAFVYAPDNTRFIIHCYIIDDFTGKLLQQTESYQYPYHEGFKVFVEPSNRFMYIYDYEDSLPYVNKIYTYSINQTTGSITLIPEFTVTVDAYYGLSNFVITPDGKYFFMTSSCDTSSVNGKIISFSINQSTGELTPLSDVIPDASQRIIEMVSSIDGSSLYVRVHPFSYNAQDVFGYSINAANGSLTQLSGSPWKIQDDSIYELKMNPNGKYLYALGAQNVLGYSITGGGLSSLGEVISESLFTGYYRDISFDNSGLFAYWQKEVSFMFSINGARINQQTGACSIISGFPVAMESSLLVLSPDPSGKYLYAANDHEYSNGKYPLTAFSIDQSTGYLTKIGTSPARIDDVWNPRQLFYDPTGKYLYELNAQIHGFSIDGSSGALTPIPGFGYIQGCGLQGECIVVKMN